MIARLGLLFVAFIWGFSFVLQRQVSAVIEPFTFNAIHFLIPAILLIPVSKYIFETKPLIKSNYSPWVGGLVCGIFMFAGSVLQQVGIGHTTASKTAFITALYIVIVPLFGLFLNHSLSFLTAIGVAVCIYGTVLLTNVGVSDVNYGDILIFLSTFCWAAQLLSMAYFAPRQRCIMLSSIQFFVAFVLNGVCAIMFETPTLAMIKGALFPILYTGVLSLAVGFTLQSIFQRVLPPAETSLILSMDMIFTSICGYFVLGETFTTSEFIGMILITTGVVLAELPCPKKYTIPPLPIWNKTKN